MKTITVTIDPSGKSTVEADGFTGKSCTEATLALEKALGVESSVRRKKKEYFYNNANATKTTQRQSH